MGYAKYTEDLNEQISINMDKIKPYVFKTETPISLRRCIYCEETFRDTETMFKHMRDKHNDKQVIVVLNDEILSPEDRFVYKIERFGFYPRSKSSTFILNDRVYDVNPKVDYQDLLPFIKPNINNIELEIEKVRRSIYINKMKATSSKVDIIINDMNMSAINRKRPEYCNVLKYNSKNNLKLPEKEYIDAFYDYFLACSIESSEKDRHYYSAYNRLLPFIENDSRARLLVKLIMVRYLWIEGLAEICKNDSPNDFSLVSAFLSGEVIGNPPQKRISNDRVFELFVEDDEFDCIQAITFLMNNEINAVKHYIGRMEIVIQSNEVSSVLKDKILLMKAELSKRNNDFREQQYYLSLIKNPYLKVRK